MRALDLKPQRLPDLVVAAIFEKLAAQGYTINGGSPQDLGNLVRTELVKWARVVKESGAKVG